MSETVIEVQLPEGGLPVQVFKVGPGQTIKSITLINTHRALVVVEEKD